MNEPLLQLLERMRASRAALAQQLQQLPSRPLSRSLPREKMMITPTQIGIGLGVAIAMRVLFPARRRQGK
jgi:hypothetical protein